MILYQELFKLLGKLMDKELDDVVPPLLKKAGEVSTAGRENFLTLEADRTLSEMCRYVSESRAAASLIASATHKAPTVSTAWHSTAWHGIALPCLSPLL